MVVLNGRVPNILWNGNRVQALMFNGVMVWPGPGILQVTADTGPDGIGDPSSTVQVTATRAGAAVAVSGVSVSIDDLDDDPPVLNWASFGNLQIGDVVTLVFRNEAITYMGGRTITGTIAPLP